jgi:hypothetical protein
MSTGTQTTVHFTRPKCGLHYSATSEQSPTQLSGDFLCMEEGCGATVHEWTGFYDFFNWKPQVMKPVRPGAKP